VANNDKLKPDFEAGMEALSGRTAKPESDDASSEYPSSPRPGTVIAHCKNKDCTCAIDFGFFYDTTTWIEKFKPQEFTCPSPKCGLKALYSRSDLEEIPAEIPAEIPPEQ